MRYYLSLPLLALAAALQASVIPALRIEGGQPDLIFLIVVAWAVHADPEEAVVWAFVGGIIQDVLSVTPTGTSVPGMLVAVFGLVWLRQQLFRVGITLIIGLTLVGTVVQEVVTHVVLAVIGLSITPAQMIELVLLPTLFYHLLLILPVLFVVRRIQKRLPQPEPTL